METALIPHVPQSISTLTKKSPQGISFEYGIAQMSDFKAEQARGKRGKPQIAKLILNDMEIIPTKRFEKSFQRRFRLSANVFRYWSPFEVFERISQDDKKAKVRYVIQHNEGKKPQMLAVTNPANPVIQYNDLIDILQEYNSEEYVYNGNGAVTSRHTPRIPMNLEIGGDDFINKFVAEIPIDGFGKPNVYLSMLRLICQNGMVGYSPMFRSEISVGKKDDGIQYSIMRALDGFNNEDGYSALTDRLEASTKSYASVGEVMKFDNLLTKVVTHGESNLQKFAIGDRLETNVGVVNDFQILTTKLKDKYGINNLDNLSQKKQRTLPTPVTVYELFNYASEIATHHSKPLGANKFQGFIGEVLSKEYDLEGTKSTYGDWTDFFIKNKDTAETMAELS